jgi:hypothetical protein
MPVIPELALVQNGGLPEMKRHEVSNRRASMFTRVTALFAIAVSAAATAEDAKVAPSIADKPIFAYWTFDEQIGSADRLADSSPRAAMNAGVQFPLRSARGVYGNAIAFKGDYSLKTGGFGLTELPEITFSAWTRPTDLGGYREIFRQETQNRILFSFQEDGSVLSLGLTIGDYIECDGAIDRNRAADSNWHFCAATFDGETIWVYFDGDVVGTLARPGKISLDPNAPAYIGSSEGKGEFFRGRLDDLRIYPKALTSEEIGTLFRDGAEAAAAADAEVDQAVSALCPDAGSFAEMVVAARKNLSQANGPLDGDVKYALPRRIEKRWPGESSEFINATRTSLADYLEIKDNSFIESQGDLLMDLLFEYKPLTERQISKQTPEDRAFWEEAEKIREKHDALKARNSDAAFDPEWVNFVLETGRQIHFRPYKHEPVAPYVRPETPETKRLTSEEARAILERDWLHQADQNPTTERIDRELQWTKALIARLESEYPGKANFADASAALAALEDKVAGASGQDPDLYFNVREIKRSVMLKNPAIDFNKLLFVDMPYPAGSEFKHETRHRLGYMAVPGARLLVLNGLEMDSEISQLMPQAPLHGSFWRPDVSYDGAKVLFCFKPHNEKTFHLYEINADGTNLTQLTDGDYDDMDPVYLPDGHIMFVTTRANSYVRCMPPTNVFTVARCDADGKNVYLISSSNEPDYLPSVMDDGRVIYTRWEYTDKPLWRAQKLWTMNPDGTQVSTMWGNQSVWPDVMKDARSIPGSNRVMFTGSAHHNWFSGSVGLIDPREGNNFPKGLTKITADVEWPECGNGPSDPVESPNYHASGKYPAYYSPYPLSERDFLVSAQRGDKFLLYLMDVDGNRELLYEGANNIFHAIPIKERVKPPVIMDRVAWPSKEESQHPKNGVLYSGNVYKGAPEELKDKAKFLRVMRIDPKTYTYWDHRPYISTGPVISAVQSDGVKRVIGTVPVEPDGSVSFEAPPGEALHFQLLDENHRALQTMRSFVGLMPGERRGCLGCHESHSKTPTFDLGGDALRREPSAIEPPPWKDNSVSYARYVRPVLDQYCAGCHEGEGKARKVFDMTERPTTPIFTEPYMTMIGRPSWGAPYSRPEKPEPGFDIANTLMVEAYSTVDPKAYVTPRPMTRLSYGSKLIDIASSGEHHGVKVDPVNLERLITWVDAMCPYLGDEEVRQIPDPEFQGVDWLAVRPKIQNAPTITRPGPVD